MESASRATESKLRLPQNLTIQDYQRYVADMVKERRFDQSEVSRIVLLLMEEVGELAKAIRKAEGMRTDARSERFDVAHEAVDVFIYLLNICNIYGIDLEKAFQDKEAINKQRKWNA